MGLCQPLDLCFLGGSLLFQPCFLRHLGLQVLLPLLHRGPRPLDFSLSGRSRAHEPLLIEAQLGHLRLFGLDPGGQIHDSGVRVVECVPDCLQLFFKPVRLRRRLLLITLEGRNGFGQRLAGFFQLRERSLMGC